MAQVTAAMVKELRQMTDSPMMECKKALVEADGDIEKAVDILRTMGVAKAVKRAGRATNEGTIAAYVSDDFSVGALLELSCETDFVGTNPKFTGFAKDLARIVAEQDPADIEALKACSMGESTVEAELLEMIHNIGENMKIIRFERVAVEGGAMNSYVHLGGKLADIVVFTFDKPETAQNPAFQTFAHDVAMQIAATSPLAAKREHIAQEIIDHEMEIYKAQAAESGKPEAIRERMALGRLEKYYKENVLAEQVFVKDSSVNITQLAAKVSKEIGDKIELVSFVRFAFGVLD